ncbi:hypothetical protein FEF26_11500 [Nesterenkonia salmonea]|uniref:Uncharacterized protein n=1 Tax=Nesterenkonia salmonea TaxID=1804987 RepID=A0A5R9B8V6_9MICC|nr:hypothetical protein [Nesterenkonia salmonea]TLP94742.1 hypothetical protein FEF26_11500 [Nesterenkonia salmonea]
MSSLDAAQLSVLNFSSKPAAVWFRNLKTNSPSGVHTAQNMGELASMLESHPGNSGLVLVNDPALALATEIDNGKATDLALGDWMTDVRLLIHSYRRNHSRMLVVDSALTLETAEPLGNHLKNKVGINLDRMLSRGSGADLSNEETAAKTMPPELIAIARLLLTEPGVRLLAEELQSITLGSSQGSPNGETIDFLLKLHSIETQKKRSTRQGSDREASEPSSAATLSENKMLVAEIQNLQLEREADQARLEQLDQLTSDHAATQEKLNALRRGRTSRRVKIAELESKLADRRKALKTACAARDQYREESVKAGSELEKRNKALADLQAENEELRKNAGRLETYNRRLLNSRSWRYTRVLRTLKGSEI